MSELIRQVRLVAKMIRRSQNQFVLLQAIANRQFRRLVITELVRS